MYHQCRYIIISRHIVINLLLSASIGNVGLAQPSCSRFSFLPHPTNIDQKMSIVNRNYMGGQ